MRHPFEGVDQPGQGERRRVVDQQVRVVGFAVDLPQVGSDVRANVADDLFGVGEDRVVEHATAVGGDGHQMERAGSLRRCGHGGCGVVRLPARVSGVDVRVRGVSRFRLYPTPVQEILLLQACAHARYVWNLGLEQRLMWRRWQGPTPGYNGQAAQLTQARAENPWLAGGSQTVQQQALRDLDQAWRTFFAGTHARPRWRKRGQHEGFRIVGAQASRVRQDNRRWSGVLVPKIGWVGFRRSRTLPDWKSYRITRDRAGRWHIAFAAVPNPIPAPGTGAIVGVDRGVKAAAALHGHAV